MNTTKSWRRLASRRESPRSLLLLGRMLLWMGTCAAGLIRPVEAQQPFNVIFFDSVPPTSISSGVLTIRVGKYAWSSGSTVDYFTSDGTAKAGVDYVSTHGTLTLPAEYSVQELQVPLIYNPAASAASLDFHITLTNVIGSAILPTPPTATLTILYPPGKVSFAAEAFSAPESGGFGVVEVTRTENTNVLSSVAFSTKDVTAVSGLDYLPRTGVLTFLPGETTKEIVVVILDNTVIEGSRLLEISLAEPSTGSVLGSLAQATLIIQDDDATDPLCTAAGLAAAIAAGGPHSFTCDPKLILPEPIQITNEVTLIGTGHDVHLLGGGLHRLFEVKPGGHLTLIDLTLSGGRDSEGGAIYNEDSVVLIGCTLENNQALGEPGTNGLAGSRGTLDPRTDGGPGTPAGNGSSGRGGAVFNLGSLHVTNTVFRSNEAVGGAGGIGGRGGAGAASSPNCALSTGNAAGGDSGAGGDGLGGAIFNLGYVMLVEVNLQENQARGGSGGVQALPGTTCFVPGPASSKPGIGGKGVGAAYYNEGTLLLIRSLASANEAHAGDGGFGAPLFNSLSVFQVPGGVGGAGGLAAGGAGFNRGSNYLVNTTLTLNRARGGSGGIGGYFSGNGCPATPGASGEALGGALENLGTLAVVNSTIWENSARGGITTNGLRSNPICNPLPPEGPPGLSFGDALVNSNQLSLVNSILGSSVSTSNVVGQLTDLGHNLCSDQSAAFSAPGSWNGIDPQLGPLGNYGGPTPTLPLPWNSPAVDAGSDADCPAVDQRGRPRPALAHCDLGAFEFVPEQIRINRIQVQPLPRLEGFGPAGIAFDIEAAANLHDFEKVAEGNVDATCRFNVEIILPTAQADPWRFFRARAK